MVIVMVMITTNVAEIKAKLSEFLERARRGERVVICRHNKPVAELRAFESVRVEPRPIGPLNGRPVFDVAASFFDPLPEEELDLWDGVPEPATRGRKPRGAARVAEDKAEFGGRANRPQGPRRR